ncbi:MAG: 3D domain-containing protein [[Clostridium] innocuum]|uniref:3D domain-containing protein n=1 Tax=Clostridium innocuum TaxID=1522 RepID=UPI003A1BA8B2
MAVDPNVIPPNSKVLIDGTVYTAEDVGSAIKGNIIDIWVGTEENSFGVKYKEVRMMEK